MADGTMTLKDAKAARRLKKAERRAKQRAANPMRAEKMHSYRLEHPLPRGEGDLPLVNVGCSGWFYWDWREKFYPSQLPTSGWFPYYAENFDTVEINASFYSWPTVAGVKAWLKGVPEVQGPEGRPFVFTVKASELITHVRQFDDCKGLIEDFGYVADLLGQHMGCLLFQLPPSFHYDPQKLDLILSQLEPGRRNVVEFRHPSWWNEEVYAAFRDTGTIFCTCSGPKLPDEMVRTADEVYVRFHGTERWYNHLYPESEMIAWAQRIADCGAKRVWVYFNNDYHANAIANARQLREALIATGVWGL